MGLQLLLGFVADRKSHSATQDRPPIHVAVLYVGMMTLGQILRGMMLGQAFEVGRRVSWPAYSHTLRVKLVCPIQITFRARAILVADIFTKALRRRDESGVTDKIEPRSERDGQQEKTPKPSLSPNITNLVGGDAFASCEYS